MSKMLIVKNSILGLVVASIMKEQDEDILVQAVPKRDFFSNDTMRALEKEYDVVLFDVWKSTMSDNVESYNKDTLSDMCNKYNLDIHDVGWLYKKELDMREKAMRASINFILKAFMLDDEVIAGKILDIMLEAVRMVLRGYDHMSAISRAMDVPNSLRSVSVAILELTGRLIRHDDMVIYYNLSMVDVSSEFENYIMIDLVEGIRVQADEFPYDILSSELLSYEVIPPTSEKRVWTYPCKFYTNPELIKRLFVNRALIPSM